MYGYTTVFDSLAGSTKLTNSTYYHSISETNMSAKHSKLVGYLVGKLSEERTNKIRCSSSCYSMHSLLPLNLL